MPALKLPGSGGMLKEAEVRRLLPLFVAAIALMTGARAGQQAVDDG